jgi:general secretion pathway protein D
MQLRLNDISPGDLLSRDGVRVTAVKDIRNDTGEATLTVSRLPGSPGISGSGVIATLNFVAVGKGSSRITAADSVLKNSRQESLTVTLGELPVTVQ